jgi:hypothetical protein
MAVMLLRNRPAGIDSYPAGITKGFKHLDAGWIDVLGWLQANRVEHILVGAAARALRGERGATGPVAIVPAPYGRNLDRVARALCSAHARLRVDDRSGAGPAATASPPLKLTAESLLRGERWTLSCGTHELDLEGRSPGAPRYQELLYEASRFEPASELLVEVASPEDIEHYEHLRRTGVAPEIVVSRRTQVQQS